MSLEISKIQNGKLQELARQCNKDDNLEYLNEEEYSIFLEEAEKMVKDDKEVKKKDLRQAKNEWVNEEFVKAPKQAYKRRLEVSDEFSKYVEKSGKFDGEVKNDVIRDLSPAHAYRKEIDEMYTVVSSLLGSGETKVDLSKREGVEELLRRRDDVQKRLDAGDRSMRGIPEVLDTIAAVSKQAIVDKETVDLIGIYYDKCSDVENFDEAKKIVKKEAEKQGLMKTSYYKEAYEAFEGFVNVLAMQKFEENLPSAEGKTRREVKKDMIKDSDDKTYKKEVRSEKAMRGVQARRNTVLERQEELTHVTADEINKELGNDLAKKLSAYIEQCKNSDGTYDLSKLSVTIQKHIGADYLMNRSDNEYISEEFQAMKGLDKHIKETTGDNPKLTDKEADTIREFCKIEKEDKERLGIGAGAPILGAAVAPAVLDAMHAHFTSVLGSTIINREYAIDVFMEVLTRVNVNAAGGVEEQVSQILANDTKLKESVVEVIAGKPDWAKVAAAGLEGAVIGALTALAFAVIFGKSQSYEKACFSLTDEGARECKTLKEYSEWATDEYGPDKARVMTALASYFADNEGNLDAVALYNYLDSIAGDGSNINCLEARAGYVYNLVPEKPEAPTPAAVEGHNMALEHTTEPETDDSIAYVTHRVDFFEVDKLTGELKWLDKKGNFMWEDIVNAFYPDLVKACGGKMYGKDGAIRALKEAMSLKFNSETGELTMDADMREKLINGGDITGVNFFPDEIRTKNGNVKFRPEKVKTRALSSDQLGGKAQTNQGGFEGGIHIRKIPGTDTWLATDSKGCSGSASTIEDAVRALKSASHIEKYDNEKEVIEQAKKEVLE